MRPLRHPLTLILPHLPRSDDRTRSASCAHSRGELLAACLALLLAVVSGLMVTGCAPFGSGNTSTHATGQPTPTSAAQGQLAHDVYLNIWGLGVQSLVTTYDPQQATARVTITLGGTVPNTDLKASAAQGLTKAFCLMALQALWTSGIPLSATTVIVQGPVQDEYADVIDQEYGVVMIEARVAQRIDWASVTADAAWTEYDHEFLRSSFVLND